MSLEPALSAPQTRDRARMDFANQQLIAGRCTSCGQVSWPRASVCTNCGEADIEASPLPREGTLTTWSRVWVPIPGVEAPYVVGLVRLGTVQLYVHVHADSDPRTPAVVKVLIDPECTPAFWAEPV